MSHAVIALFVETRILKEYPVRTWKPYPSCHPTMSRTTH